MDNAWSKVILGSLCTLMACLGTFAYGYGGMRGSVDRNSNDIGSIREDIKAQSLAQQEATQSIIKMEKDISSIDEYVRRIEAQSKENFLELKQLITQHGRAQ